MTEKKYKVTESNHEEIKKGEEVTISGVLEENEPHPGAQIAWRFIQSFSEGNLKMIEEGWSAIGKDGNRICQICSETLRRIRCKEPVSDRYIMGLAWTLMEAQEIRKSKEKQLNRKQRRAAQKKPTIN